MTTLTSLLSGHDVAYFLREREAGGCVGAMSYYTACGEPPGVWAGTGAERLGLTGLIEPAVIEALCMKGVGTDGQRLRRSCTEDWPGSRESTVREPGRTGFRSPLPGSSARRPTLWTPGRAS